jgi:predicted DNA binding CopG/RHH family protein
MPSIIVAVRLTRLVAVMSKRHENPDRRDPEQHARVKQKAASLGITMAEYIRRLVEDDLAGVDPQGSS